MAEGSQKPTFSQYNVKPVCEGCGRKLVVNKEPALWFVGFPRHAVYGQCCFGVAAASEPSRMQGESFKVGDGEVFFITADDPARQARATAGSLDEIILGWITPADHARWTALRDSGAVTISEAASVVGWLGGLDTS